MSIALDHLNPEQRAVAVARGHVLAIACPGSGKTSTVATKAAYLLDQGDRVGAVTFTKDAAQELRERIVKIAGPECVSRLLVGTFHSVSMLMGSPQSHKGNFGRAILQEMKSPYTAKWDIINTGQQAGYVGRAIKEVGLKFKFQEALAAIELAKASRSPELIDPDILQMTEIYQDLLKRAGKIDFQDIILLTNAALEKQTMTPLPVDHLMVDEFQDTDDAQYGWIWHHARGGAAVTAVGDDDQSIYAFRRALGVEGMTRFVQDFGAERILLGTNYRCKAEILGAAAELIAKNSDRIDKRLVAAKGEGGVVLWDAYASTAAEANAVADEAAQALEDGATFAVIAHTNRELIELQKAMVVRDLPFRKASGQSLFDCVEVQTYAALLRSIIKPVANDVDQVLAWGGMSESDTREIRRLFGSMIRSGSTSDFTNTKVSEEGRKLWRSFAKRHGEWVALLSQGASSLINIGVHEWMLETLQQPNSAYVLETAADLFDPKQNSLDKHLTYMKATEMRLRQEESAKPDPSREPINAVQLLTAHGSKGLEFDRVWIVGVSHGSFPSDKSSLEEERRLMFVAMTRAREVLWVSGTKEKRPSIFVYEAGLLQVTHRK